MLWFFVREEVVAGGGTEVDRVVDEGGGGGGGGGGVNVVVGDGGGGAGVLAIGDELEVPIVVVGGVAGVVGEYGGRELGVAAVLLCCRGRRLFSFG